MKDLEHLDCKCPVCERSIPKNILEEKGLTFNLIRDIEKHIQARSLDQVFKIAEIVITSTQQDKVSQALLDRQSLDSTQQMIGQMLDSFHNHQAKLLGDFLNTDESKKKQLLSEHVNMQDKLIEQYKRDVFEKMELIRRAEEIRSQEYGELTKSVKELQNKVFGPTIGTIGEIVTILDLKRFCPGDSFSELRASKHGTDIVGEVVEHGKKCGTISISVKYQMKWDSSFISQLTRNMQEDNSRWGVLVTKVFPKEALNDKMWTTRNAQGQMIFMVKPEYSPLAYYASRQIAIHWNSIENMIRSKEAAQKHEENIKRKVVNWITGEKFQKTAGNISRATEMNKQIAEGLISMQAYLSERIKNLRGHGDEIHFYLESIGLSLLDLKQLLESKDSSYESILTSVCIDKLEPGADKKNA